MTDLKGYKEFLRQHGAKPGQPGKPAAPLGEGETVTLVRNEADNAYVRTKTARRPSMMKAVPRRRSR
jgi:hypothetical protein